MNVVGVIPARYASTRFPGKILTTILGKPMVQWVYERAMKARGLDRLLVATDDERIRRAVEAFGGEARMTSAHCPSGTDRVNEAVGGLSCDVVLNLQGDEPALDPVDVESLIDLMKAEPSLCMGTLVAPIREPGDYENPDVVKVVMGLERRCVYFSRSPVPFLRGRAYGQSALWRHVGITPLEKSGRGLPDL